MKKPAETSRPKQWKRVEQLEVSYRDDGPAQRVGLLFTDTRDTVHFEYAAEWISHGIELSPIQLPLARGVSAGPDPKRLHGLHGLFADSLPDYWGTRIIDSAFSRYGISRDAIGPLDRLSYLGDSTMGALTYEPSPKPTHDSTADLDTLAAEADAFAAGAPQATAALDDLQRAAGSAGGAQPKVLGGISADGSFHPGVAPPSEYQPVLIKFTPNENVPGIRADSGVLELAYSRMAAEAGVKVPHAFLVRTSDGRGHFTVHRFDRFADGRRRRHVHTLGALFGRESSDVTDYDELLRVARTLTRDAQMVTAAFHLLCFNIAAVNDDDHSHNVAFMLEPNDDHREWVLAPAYDLTYSPNRASIRGMSLAGIETTPAWSDIEALASRHGIKARPFADIRSKAESAVRNWAKHASDAGVSSESADEVSTAIAQRLAFMEK